MRAHIRADGDKVPSYIRGQRATKRIVRQFKTQKVRLILHTDGEISLGADKPLLLEPSKIIELKVLRRERQIGSIKLIPRSKQKVYLADMEIFEEERRKGYGRRAVNLLERTLALHGVEKIELEDRTILDHEYKSFWKQIGYRRDKDDPAYLSKKILGGRKL